MTSTLPAWAQASGSVEDALRLGYPVYLDLGWRRVRVVSVDPDGFLRVAYGPGDVGIVRLPTGAGLRIEKREGVLAARVRRREAV